MHQIKVKVCSVLLLISGFTGLQAQEAIPASGGDASGSGGSVSYSVGQVVYNTNTGTSGSVAQGVQQPYEISVVSGIEEATSISLICSAYPNPATDFLTLKVENFNKADLSYQLFDVDGKRIENKIIEGNETSIIMSNLAPSTYFLKVIQNNKEVKTFKIVKN
jgi:hypothetical protein